MKNKIPYGLKIISALFMLNALLSILGTSFISFLDIAIGLIWTIAWATISIGLWKLKPWAKKGAITLALIELAISLILMINNIDALAGLITIAIDVIIIRYLWENKEVKNIFK